VLISVGRLVRVVPPREAEAAPGVRCEERAALCDVDPGDEIEGGLLSKLLRVVEENVKTSVNWVV
jgi:hypothetical protein